MRVIKMAQQVNRTDAKPDNWGLIPGVFTGEE